MPLDEVTRGAQTWLALWFHRDSLRVVLGQSAVVGSIPPAGAAGRDGAGARAVYRSWSGPGRGNPKLPLLHVQGGCLRPAQLPKHGSQACSYLLGLLPSEKGR